jgi:hypothetical protein
VIAFFWIATPFLVFLKHHGYGILRGEALLCLAGAAVVSALLSIIARRWPVCRPFLLAGVIAFFFDVQFDEAWRPRHLALMFPVLSLLLWYTRAHAPQVLMAVGATMFVSTLVLPADRQQSPQREEAVQRSGNLPFTLHIILDEHIGVEGLPPDADSQELARDLRAFFHKNEFMLFGGAYSSYFNTVRSLSHQFNFADGTHNPDLYEKSTAGFTWRLTRNQHLSELIRKGYAVRVYQSNHVNVCGDAALPLVCDTYNYTGISALMTAPLSVVEKAFVLASIFVTRTAPYQEFTKHYVSASRRLLGRGIVLPVWNGLEQSVGPLITAATMATVKERLAAARPDQYVLAHLLIPHSPYVYDAECNILPPWQWLGRSAPAGFSNTDDGRKVRYRMYVAQARCTTEKLQELLDAIPLEVSREAVVILQGDHGSRITTAEPSASSFGQLTARDYIDGYSTLFAVRAPGLPSTYDTRALPTACLFKVLVESGFAGSTNVDACLTPPSVFVIDSRGLLNVASLPAFTPN